MADPSNRQQYPVPYVRSWFHHATMQPGALRALEFDRIVEAVRGFALTPMGAERLARLAPSTDPQQVAQRLAATTETARYLADARRCFRCARRASCREILAALAVEGRALEPLRLLALATFLDSVDESRAAIRRAPARFRCSTPPAAAPRRSRAKSAQVRDKIDPSGEVVDHASPELRLDSRPAPQAADAAARHARVVPARQGHGEVPAGPGRHRAQRPLRARRQGRAPQRHSGHRARRVDERRQPVSRAAQHGRDQQRHRRARGAGSRGSPAHPARADRRVPRARGGLRSGRSTRRPSSTCCRRGRASRSRSTASSRALSTDGAFELQAARHPLLKSAGAGHDQDHPAGDDPARHRAEHRRQDRRAQDGRAARADGAGRTADPGRATDRGCRCSDRSSPTSATSSRLKRASARSRRTSPTSRRWTASLATPALVLLDEVGSGTDPIEGGALGVAIVDHFRRRGATVIATSHYDALKTYASTTDGVASAAFGFDADTFAPTYQLIYGSPGRSLALEIAGAARPEPVGRRGGARRTSARAKRSSPSTSRRSTTTCARSSTSTGSPRASARRSKPTEARMRQREDALKPARGDVPPAAERRARDAQVRQARREIDEVIAELKAKSDAIAREAPRQRRHDRRYRRGARRRARRGRRRRQALARAGRAAAATDAGSRARRRASAAAVGDRVIVGGLGLEAVVTAVHDGIGRTRRARQAHARQPRAICASSAPREPARTGTRTDRVNVNVELAAARGAARRI